LLAVLRHYHINLDERRGDAHDILRILRNLNAWPLRVDRKRQNDEAGKAFHADRLTPPQLTKEGVFEDG
jgi:hypothetical protein